MSTMQVALLVTCFGLHVAGRAAARPEATVLQPINPRGWTPKPTVEPMIRLDKRIHSGLVGPSNFGTSTSAGGQVFGQICGYEYGSAQHPIGCNIGYQCCHNDKYKVEGCCGYPVASYTPPTTCIGYSDNAASASSASFNSLTQYCTSSQYPYCLTQYFQENGYSFINCGDIKSISSVDVLLSTIPSSASSASSSVNKSVQKLRSKLHSLSQQHNHPQKSSSSSSSSSSTSPSTHPQPKPTVHGGGGKTTTTTPVGGGGGKGGGSHSSSTPIGAIVGGVVGGVAVIALIVFVIWFVLRKRKKDREEAAAGAAAGGFAGQHGPGGPPVSQASPVGPGSDPRASYYSGAPSASPAYSPPQQYKTPYVQPLYSTPASAGGFSFQQGQQHSPAQGQPEGFAYGAQPIQEAPGSYGYPQQPPPEQHPALQGMQQPATQEMHGTSASPTMSKYSELPGSHPEGTQQQG